MRRDALEEPEFPYRDGVDPKSLAEPAGEGWRQLRADPNGGWV